MEMEIKKAREEKVKVEEAILKILCDFQDRTGLFVDSIYVISEKLYAADG